MVHYNMAIVVEPVHSIININSHTHIEKTPFATLGDLVYIEKAWWQQIYPWVKSKILCKFGEHYGYAVRDSIPSTATRNGKAFSQFLSAYNSIFTIDNWVNCTDSTYSIAIVDKGGMQKIGEIAKTRAVTVDDIKSKYNPLLFAAIIRYLETNKDTGIFMRFNTSSPKKMSPKFTISQIFAELLDNPKSDIMFMTPWRYEISRAKDFRVFVYNNHVSAVSQKECYKFVGLSYEKVTIIAKNILECIAKQRVEIPFKTYIADVWIDGTNAIHILKILPGEPWTSTESCLFNWIDDDCKIRQTDKTYIKYIDINSPMIRALCGSVDSIILS